VVTARWSSDGSASLADAVRREVADAH